MDTNKKRKQYGRRPLIELFYRVCEANAGIIGNVASALGVRQSTVYSGAVSTPNTGRLWTMQEKRSLILPKVICIS